MKHTPENGDVNRDTVFRVRVTSHEKETIKNLAAQSGMTVSRYLRTLIDEKPVMTKDRELLIRLQAELGKNGSNLNQIARAINMRMKTGEAIDISPSIITYTLESISALTHHILQVLKNGRFRKSKG